MLLESRLKVSDIKPDQGHLDIDKIEHFIDLRNTPVYFFYKKSIIRQKNRPTSTISTEKTIYKGQLMPSPPKNV